MLECQLNCWKIPRNRVGDEVRPLPNVSTEVQLLAGRGSLDPMAQDAQKRTLFVEMNGDALGCKLKICTATRILIG